MRNRPQPPPAHFCPVPPPPPVRSWLWQLPLGVALTLGALFWVAGLVDHCTGDSALCPAPEQVAQIRQLAPPPPPPPAPPSAVRPVMQHALTPLPLGMGNGPTPQNYLLPPGKTVEDAATRPGAIALDAVNLIAVVEAEGIRHALVRLPDGRILRLREGDRLEDATVAAIGDNTLYMLRPDNTAQALVLGG